MNRKSLIIAWVAASLLGTATVSSVRAQDDSAQDSAGLLAKVKYTEAQALVIAQAAVPTGVYLASALEDENGTPVWAFAFTTPGTKAITEVKVDAITGSVVPEDQTGVNDTAGPDSQDGPQDE